MANLILLSIPLSLLDLPLLGNALSDCSGPCKTLDDCSGQLICINGKCNDDPDVGTTICKGGSTPSPTPPNDALSDCFGPCKTLDDCYGQLICINGKCNDDPEVGTTNCKGGSTPSPTPLNSCKPAGTLICEGNTYSTYNCSPQVTAATSALLTLNDFSESGDGGGPSECDEMYHPNTERVVALSTGWYNRGSRCGKMIRITASNGRSVTAKVVDECDSMNGCDEQSAGLGPCKNNSVDGSAAVWNSLGLNQTDGVVNVTWSMAGTDLAVCHLRHANLVACHLRQWS